MNAQKCNLDFQFKSSCFKFFFKVPFYLVLLSLMISYVSISLGQFQSTTNLMGFFLYWHQLYQTAAYTYKFKRI